METEQNLLKPQTSPNNHSTDSLTLTPEQKNTLLQQLKY